MTVSVDFRKSADVQKHSGIFLTDPHMLGFSHLIEHNIIAVTSDTQFEQNLRTLSTLNRIHTEETSILI